MEKVNQFIGVIEKAFSTATPNFSNQESVKKATTDKDECEAQLRKDSYIKVPFVGDFSAGKSSLINAMLGVDFLPTDILPETAVSYELYYSPTEKLEVWEDDKLQKTVSLSEIKDLQLNPKDLVKVYINNEFIKGLFDRNIVLVDMPGIDSGIEAHNNAILHYIQDGTYFFLLTDAEGGTLRQSALNFIDEVKKYGASVAVVISKIDKKPAEEIPNIKATVEKIAKLYVGADVKVATSSAVDKNFSEVTDILNSIDSEKIIEQKYEPLVKGLINGYIAELQLQIKLLLQDKSHFEEKIQQLKDEKANALAELKRKSESAQSVEGSADDILNDITQALKAKANYLATLLYNGQDMNVFKAEVLTIIRPVIVNSFKREITEYQDVIGQAVQEFSVKADEILNDKDNKVLDEANDLIDNLLGRDVLEGLLKKGLDKLAERFVGYKGLGMLFKTLGKVIGPVVTIAINIIPDLLRLIFGKSKEQKISELSKKISSTVISKIIEAMRPQMEEMIREQRGNVDKNLEQLIEDETSKYDDNIRAILAQQQQEKEATAKKLEALKQCVDALNALLQTI